MAESKVNVKQIIITAAVTGFFTLLVGLRIYFFTTKAPALSYSVVESPILPIQNKYKQIYVIEVHNTGKKEVLNVASIVEITKGEIEEAAYEAPRGLKLTEKKSPSSYFVEIPFLNPEENLKGSSANRVGKNWPTNIKQPSILAGFLIRKGSKNIGMDFPFKNISDFTKRIESKEVIHSPSAHPLVERRRFGTMDNSHLQKSIYLWQIPLTNVLGLMRR